MCAFQCVSMRSSTLQEPVTDSSDSAVRAVDVVGDITRGSHGSVPGREGEVGQFREGPAVCPGGGSARLPGEDL